MEQVYSYDEQEDTQVLTYKRCANCRGTSKEVGRLQCEKTWGGKHVWDYIRFPSRNASVKTNASSIVVRRGR